MKIITVGDILRGDGAMYLVTDIYKRETDDSKLYYKVDTWFDGKGFVTVKAFAGFTASEIVNSDLKIYKQ